MNILQFAFASTARESLSAPQSAFGDLHRHARQRDVGRLVCEREKAELENLSLSGLIENAALGVDHGVPFDLRYGSHPLRTCGLGNEGG